MWEIHEWSGWCTRMDKLDACESVQVGMCTQDCPERAANVSAPPPDPRAMKTAQHPPGQTDVQNSLPGRHGNGRVRNRRRVPRATLRLK